MKLIMKSHLLKRIPFSVFDYWNIKYYISDLPLSVLKFDQ